MSGSDLIFLVFAVIAVGSAVFVVVARKIVYAAFSLMLSLFGVAGLYVFLSADFIAAVQVIIYVGGILVLILFGVLLTVKITSVTVTTKTAQRLWGSFTVIGFIALLLAVIFRTPWSELTEGKEQTYLPQSENIGRLLMSDYLLPFEIASILLLAALVGAMFIVRSEEK